MQVLIISPVLIIMEHQLSCKIEHIALYDWYTNVSGNPICYVNNFSIDMALS